MRKRYFFFITVTLAFTAVFTSCTDFFSNSWARWAARDPDKLVPKVTAGNVDELIATAENNPDLSLAILKKIQAATNGASEDDKLKLQSAALGAAANAAGLGQAVLGAAGQLTSLSGDNSEDDIKDATDMLLNAINGMKNLEASCAALCGILPDPADQAAFDAFTAAASANDLAMAAAMLIAGEVKNQVNNDVTPEEYLEDIKNRIEQGDDLKESENLARAMALAAAIPGRENELSGPLKDVLEGLNLLNLSL